VIFTVRQSYRKCVHISGANNSVNIWNGSKVTAYHSSLSISVTVV